MFNPFSFLVDWLSTHLVAIGFLVFAVVALLARGPLFGLDDWSPASSQVERTPAPAAAESPEGMKLPVRADRADAALEAPATPPSPPAAPIDPAALSEKTAEAVVFRPTQPDASDHHQFVPLSVVEEAEKDARDGEGTLVSLDQGLTPVAPESDALLQSARTAFWEGALDRAEGLYLNYLATRPTDANGFGELGNLYQSMGRPDDALDAYFEAGVRFMTEGDQEQLAQIIELLSGKGDPRAAELQ